MNKPCLAVLLLAIGLAAPGVAQQVPFVSEISASDPCAEYFGCLNYGDLTEAQARTARGHPQFVEPQTAIAREVGTSPDFAGRTGPIAASSPR